ncbi:hypothetical protein yc1106_09416 [Curvularia clavata]|uniref:Heterokaryon incompatibility domain-containing protein n=1 Tax=Curvularia clavata TaxID=95742 RepID=A0A9Q8ZHN3_CURCL|nr:hypothetical protein yc1106_09416 [Curvularia clavata]
MQWITGRLSRCEENHGYCARNAKTRLPTRILDLSGGLVRLCETKYESGSYACLSHCATLESRKSGIPWYDLPKTFQEAISITRELGLNRLWIDSLCVIQDIKEDWQLESAQMAGIYQNAFLTLAATSSPDSNGGLWVRSQSNTSTSCKVILRHGGKEYPVYVKKRPVHWPAATKTYVNQTFPLLTRGWVYQELLLSPRFLHFGKDELVWECLEESVCECGGYSLDNWTKGKYDYSLTNSAATKWRKIVEEYSTKTLSFGSDRLPALSGLAKVNRDLWYGYLAGLWSDSLQFDLLWRVNKTDLPNAARPTEYRAPSWSWASVDAPISYWPASFCSRTYADKAKCWTIIRAETTRAGLDPTGEVSAGVLKVEAVCFDGHLRLDMSSIVEAESPGFSVAFQGSDIPFFADFNLALTGDDHFREGIVLVRATPDILLVLSVESGTHNVYKRIGISRRNPFTDKEKTSTHAWELEGKKRMLSII